MYAGVFCWYNFFIDAYKYSSNYLLISIIIVLVSVLYVWIYDSSGLNKLNKDNVAYLVAKVDDAGGNATENIISEDTNADDWPIRHDVKQQLIEKMGTELTKEQLELEKEVEAKQLETIFKLLQEQKDKLQVSSMEQLREQMKLYRK